MNVNFYTIEYNHQVSEMKIITPAFLHNITHLHGMLSINNKTHQHLSPLPADIHWPRTNTVHQKSLVNITTFMIIVKSLHHHNHVLLSMTRKHTTYGKVGQECKYKW